MRLVIIIFILSSFFLGCSSDKKTETSELQSGELQYTAPAEWIAEAPSSSMRKAQYRLPGADGADAAEMALFHFPGGGGSVEANLNRWYGQFSQPDGSSTAKKAERKQVKTNGLEVTVVYVTGTYLQSNMGMRMGHSTPERTGYAMLAAIIESAEGPWFFKATGPQATIDHWRPAFDAFVKTFKLGEKKAV